MVLNFRKNEQLTSIKNDKTNNASMKLKGAIK